MKCSEFETVLNELLDLRVDPTTDLQIQRHVDICTSCRDELGIYVSIVSLGDKKLTPKQIEQPAKSGLRKTPSRNFAAYSFLACAASILLVILSPIGNLLFEKNVATSTVAKATQNLGNENPQIKNDAIGNSAIDTLSEQLGNQPILVPDLQSTADLPNPAAITQLPNKGYWTNNALRPIKRPLSNFQHAFQSVPDAPDLEDLERVGESLGTVWKTIQEDDYILPIVQRGAFLLVSAR